MLKAISTTSQPIANNQIIYIGRLIYILNSILTKSNFMKRFVLTCCLFKLITFSVVCFGQNLLWGAHFSSTPEFPNSGSEIISTYEDGQGNLYMTGQFSGKIDFDPGPDTFFLDAYSHTEIFVAKMNADGALLWAKHLEGNGLAIGNTILGDDANEIYVSGQFRNIVDFDPGEDTVSINAFNQGAGFLLKLNDNGEFIWVKRYGIIFNTIVQHTDGNLLAIGSFNGTKDIDPGTGVTNLISKGGSDIAVAKFTSSGDLIWGHSIGGSDNDIGRSCDSDQEGNIYFTGSFQKTVDFDPGPDSTKLSGQGIFLYDDIFICKFNAAGDFIWVNGFGSTSNLESGNVIRVDSDQNLVVAGKFAGSVDFNPGPGTYQLSAGGGFGSFICKYTTEGKYVWAKSFESPSEVITTSMDIDHSNFITCAGSFKVRADFNPFGQSFVLNALGGSTESAFVCNLYPDGRFRWAVPFEGNVSAASNTILYDRQHNLYTTGEFYQSGDFNPGDDSLLFDIPGTYLNAYLVKLQTCVPTTSSVAVTACNEYLSPSENHIWTQSGIYQDSIFNHQGCDSIITIDLEIFTYRHASLYIPPTFQLRLSGNVVYQWLDCNNAMLLSLGNNQTFTPLSSGHYAVALYPDNMCFDTSSCINVTVVSTQFPDKDIQVQFYPNPGSEVIHISYPEHVQVESILIRNLTGEIVSQWLYPSVMRNSMCMH
jgi:predicted RNA-binding protein with PUA domain